MTITKDILYIGVNDHDIDLFEGLYDVPNGMAYNSYAILDDKIAIMDSVDQHFGKEWLGNISAALAGSVHTGAMSSISAATRQSAMVLRTVAVVIVSSSGFIFAFG
jgi:hypothetical protein